MRSFCNKNMVSFTLGQGFSTWGLRTPRGSREDFQGCLDGSCVFLYYYFLISCTRGKKYRLKTPRRFCLILRFCDATMWTSRLCQLTCASVRVRLLHRQHTGGSVWLFYDSGILNGKKVENPCTRGSLIHISVSGYCILFSLWALYTVL